MTTRRRFMHLATAALAMLLAAPLVACSGGEPFPAGEPVDLVLLADSGGWGVSDRYATLASEALDREVRIHDHTVNGQNATQILSGVRGAWADDVADAEIVVLYVHPGGFEPPSMSTCLDAVDAVLDPDYTGPDWSPGMTWAPPAVTTVEDWQMYRDALDQVYDAIWSLRADRPTILRAYGIWNPWLDPWRQVGIEPECTANLEALDRVRREAAEAAGAGFASLFDVFNGPGHDEDPAKKGWIDGDGTHANDAGQAAIVDALAGVGFEVSEPPR